MGWNTMLSFEEMVRPPIVLSNLVTDLRNGPPMLFLIWEGEASPYEIA